MKSTIACALCLFTLAACTPHAHATADAGDAALDAEPLEAAVDAQPSNPDSGNPEDSLPPSTSDDLTARARHLLEAIAKDDPELATDIVFPRDAYIASKDAADPGKQWDVKVMGAFKNGVHALHKRTKGVEGAVFTSFELGRPVSQTVPKKREMTRSLWHVKKSRILFSEEGKQGHVDVAEMMSWRGAWYLLKLR